ncbi:MAG: Hpt domain-containing protein, partial [Vallitaleaceae bacterium]|nr:Hpt domain-containing protein [Vallitaleaceae bacterium]
MSQFVNEPMLEMYIFETSQMLELLEQAILANEKTSQYSEESINEIFRFMHTIKGSSAMMLFNTIAALAHSMEDLFYFLREHKPSQVDYSTLSDLVFEGVDFIKVELIKIKGGDGADGQAQQLIDKIKEFLIFLKAQNPSDKVVESVKSPEKQQYYIAHEKTVAYLPKNLLKASVFFDMDCGMESIRAYTIIHNLTKMSEEVHSVPEVVSDNSDHSDWIKENGFDIYIKTNESYEEIEKFLKETIFLRELKLEKLENEEAFSKFNIGMKKVVEDNEIRSPLVEKKSNVEQIAKEVTGAGPQSIISVNVDKLDKLMDLVGELVISEAMVTQNPELLGLELDNFLKAARQLHKITTEIQDMVMSIRMVPLSSTFKKMQRITRDMCKKLGKEVELDLIGEETEVDKNIIEHIADPLMHLIRNSIDHGI